ncbi:MULTISPECIES: molybdopterin converting factor subunit 1 [unclassified Meiothermus]|uniref:molybdopterin converting factor subunit 1 n=1 Tax=unclassified Meiothermus TaxID=370471 RepID=UPI000D7C59E7|nr:MULTISPECIES: molybdopterin converting factor subunit 1 [unclassified Meiothermus]PZA06247.1 molybdopterin converting factor subunit 1 [Meiothermus sp. Pnk-1]RYM39521.1 molybdopterin converting factor subunit 1 [Meiothermus sp. PNK-Is4]
MRVRVLLFALFREQAGTGALELELPQDATVRTAKETLEARFPGLELSGGLAAVNQRFIKADHPLHEGDELAFLPPVSGGNAEGSVGDEGQNSFGLTPEPLNLQPYVEWASAPPYGAVVVFLGTTRSPNRGKEVTYLEYEAYPGMAEATMRQIITEMRQRWVLGRIALWHRTGRVHPAEASILIVVSAPHRPEAFEACRYAIERVKQTLPIWKKEFAPDGSHWVEGHTPSGFQL